ncbi:MAG: M20/M25/M40 family metallo-hydrolase [Bryobacterales bacterium]|nr:M20/M25/M40 family metallo-hydrolase [Bryobacterales bacterium]
MRAQFLAMGYDSRLDGAGNVLAARSLDIRSPLVVVSAHLDTVLSPRRDEDIRVEADGTIRGPGVADNGAGLSGLLALAKVFRELPEDPKDIPLLFVANVCEEGEGNLTGMRYLCRESEFASRIAGVLVLDGPGHEHITCGALASRRFEVLLQGKGGHSWSDFGTANPVHALARAIALFADANSPALNQHAERYSFNVGLLQGGASINSIPQSASAKVDIRSERESLIHDLAESLKRCVERGAQQEQEHARRGKLTVRVREIGARPGGRLPADSPLFTIAAAVDKELGIQSQMDTSSTDANIPLSLGIPALSLGAGGAGGGAHTTDEWYRPEGRDLGLRRAFLMLCAMRASAGCYLSK